MADSLGNWEYGNKHIEIDTYDQSTGNYTKTSPTTAQDVRYMTADKVVIYYKLSDASVSYNLTTGAGVSNASNQSANVSKFSPLGLLQAYNWMEQRQVDQIWEIGSGLPYLVPGRAQGQISLSRIYLFDKDLTNVLHGGGINTSSTEGVTGSDNWINSLKDARQAFDIAVVAFASTLNDNQQVDLTLKKVHSKVFRNCWINSKSESLAAGQITIMEQVSIMYENVCDVNFASA